MPTRPRIDIAGYHHIMNSSSNCKKLAFLLYNKK